MVQWLLALQGLRLQVCWWKMVQILRRKMALLQETCRPEPKTTNFQEILHLYLQNGQTRTSRHHVCQNNPKMCLRQIHLHVGGSQEMQHPWRKKMVPETSQM